MPQVFPYRFEAQESGGMLVQFVDVPEGHTSGASEADAGGATAQDCLIAALGGYIRLGRAIPPPSPARGRPVAVVPPLVAAKLALHEAMRAERIRRSELARRLGLQENAVRRLLDLDHRSHLDQLERALAALGRRLETAAVSCAETERPQEIGRNQGIGVFGQGRGISASPGLRIGRRARQGRRASAAFGSATRMRSGGWKCERISDRRGRIAATVRAR